MANEIKLKIKVDDDGNLKIVAKNAEKAAAGLEKTSKSANTADRRLKGAAQASANSTKNFAKLTQATGGIVGAYATLAASLFAVSAAYNFLKRAGDLTTLEAGQKAYAASTGTALRSLTSDIIEATDAQVTFRDAAQAAAIGTAAGLGADQLVRLGKAAKDTSIILGRDVTDSFNRLVRGVTKAEPELLDELGIILRLETATKKYAASIGKNAKDLTAFERSQAVANEVLEQSEEKYSKILELTGASGNEFAKLGKAFDDIVIKLQKFAAAVAGPLAKVLTETPVIAGAAFGILLQGPLKALGVSFIDIKDNAVKGAEAASKNFDVVAEKAKIASTNAEGARKSFKGLAANIKAAGGSAKFLDKISEGKSLAPLEKARLDKALKAAKANVDKFGTVTKGVFKDVKLSMVNEFEQGFRLVNVAEDKKLSKTKVWSAKMKLAYAGAGLAARSIGSALATGLSVALSWLTWITLAYTAFQILNDKFQFFNTKLSEGEKLLEKNVDKLKEVNEELENFRALQLAIASGGKGFEALSNVGAAFSNISDSQLDFVIEQTKDYIKIQKERKAIDEANAANAKNKTKNFDYNTLAKAPKLTKAQEESGKFLTTLASTVTAVRVQFGTTTKATDAFEAAFRNLSAGVEGSEKEFKAAVAGLQALDKLNKDIAKSSVDSAEAYDSFVGSLSATSKGQTALDSISNNLENLREKRDELAQSEANLAKPSILIRATGTQSLDSRYMPGSAQDQANSAALAAIRAEIKAEEDKEKTIKKFEAARIKRQTALLNAKVETVRVTSGELPGSLALIKAQDKKNLLDAESADIKARQLELEDTIKTVGGELSDSNKENRLLLAQQLKLNEAKLAVATDEVTTAQRLKDIRNEQFNLSTNNTLLNAQKELLSIDQKRIQIARETLSIQETLANTAIEGDLLKREQNNPFAFLDQDRAKADAKYELEKELIASKIKAVETERDIKLKSIDLEYDLLDAKYLQTKLELQALATKDNISEQDKQKIADTVASIDIARGGLGELQTNAENLIKLGAESGVSSLLLNLEKLEDAKTSLSDMGQLTDTLSESFGNNFVSAINGVIQGTTNLKDAFKNMAKGVLQALAQVIAKLIAIKLLNMALGFFAGGGASASVDQSSVGALGDGYVGGLGLDSGSSLAARNGGMFEKVPGYSMGGIAKGRQAGYPAVLHGTEAVVPLPNGRSIPVEMGKGMGQSNNVVVNVTVDSNGNSKNDTQSDNQQGEGLGRSIAAAVQKELLNQKRSGGILNPYGVA